MPPPLVKADALCSFHRLACPLIVTYPPQQLAGWWAQEVVAIFRCGYRGFATVRMPQKNSGKDPQVVAHKVEKPQAAAKTRIFATSKLKFFGKKELLDLKICQVTYDFFSGC